MAPPPTARSVSKLKRKPYSTIPARRILLAGDLQPAIPALGELGANSVGQDHPHDDTEHHWAEAQVVEEGHERKGMDKEGQDDEEEETVDGTSREGFH